MLNSDLKLAKTIAITNLEIIPSYGKFSNSCFKKAFTLAEVLITLTIIGVVAAMTIPTLLLKYQKNAYVTGLKKGYAQLTNAFKMVPLTEGCSGGDYNCAGWGDTNSVDGKTFASKEEKCAYLISKQFKISKSCLNGSGNTGCSNMGRDDLSFITDDGMSYSIAGCNSTAGYIDVNGNAGPNKMGRDIFVMHFDIDTYPGIVIPAGAYNDRRDDNGFVNSPDEGYSYYWKVGNGCTARSLGSGLCAGRVLEEDAMNY